MTGRQLFQIVILLLLLVIPQSIEGITPDLNHSALPAAAATVAGEAPESSVQETPAPERSPEANRAEALPPPASEPAAPAEAPAAASKAEAAPPAEKKSERPAAVPAAAAVDRPAEAKPPPPPEPALLAYRWGAPHRVSFRTQIRLTNTGGETAEHVWADLPLLENSSPYQSNTLVGTNYPIEKSRGRVASFHLDELAPGETKTVTVDYQVTIRPVSLSSTDDTVERARQAYRQHAGSGNCRTLASRFVESCRELGVTARLVNGFTRPQRALLSPGSLNGCRHSWAEIHVDGLGWVPVDLTFGYFTDFPYASHLVECYEDQPVRINYLGGKVEAVWENAILP